MLILTRKPGESLFIGDEVKVTIIEIKGNQIRIGIDAPKDQRIYREEIYLQIIEQNKEAAGMLGSDSLESDKFTSAISEQGNKSSLQGQTAINKLVIKPVSGMNLAKGKGMPVSKKDTAQDGSAAFAKLSQPVAPAVEIKRSVIKRDKNPSESES